MFCDSKALVALSTAPAPLNIPKRSCSVRSTKRERTEKQVLRAVPANAASLSSAWRTAPGLAIADGHLPEARQGDYDCSNLIIGTRETQSGVFVVSRKRPCAGQPEHTREIGRWVNRRRSFGESSETRTQVGNGEVESVQQAGEHGLVL